MVADRCRGWAWVALLLSFPVWAFCGGFCGVSRRLLGVSGIFVGLAASAALRAFYIVFAVRWCPASRRGVGADPWRLVMISGRGVGGGSRRRLGVAYGLLRGAVTGCGGWRWVRVLSSFRGVCDGLVRRLLRRWWAFSRALWLGVGLWAWWASRACAGLMGCLEGIKKPGRYAPVLCLSGMLVKCLWAVRQCSKSLSRSSSGIAGKSL